MIGFPKPGRSVNEKLRAWIRTLPCVDCKKGTWDEQKGVWRNHASHVLKKATHPNDEDNLVSHCFMCHPIFEKWSPERRAEYLPMARALTMEFKMQEQNV